MSETVFSDLLGPPAHVAVERALAEFRSGRPVIMTGGDTAMLALPVDGIDDRRLTAFRALCAPQQPCLVVAAHRSRALGFGGHGPLALAVGANDSATAIRAIAADPDVEQELVPEPLPALAGAAIELAKLAQRLPALLMANAPPASDHLPIVSLASDSIGPFRRTLNQSLVIAAEAEVPLSGGLDTRFVVFRDEIGGQAIAVVVGRPDFTQPVPVRLHSACLTGDVFGSRRCDCGDQLHLALARLDQEGGGIILYLEQEGRGLGLANKMRAYRLQDAGLDTLDANLALGFEGDERDYGIAVRMLHMLGCTRIKLLTNNPAKVEGLAQAGIEVVGRIPLHGPVNSDNRRYLTVKATRAGHQFDELLSASGRVSDVRSREP